MLATWHGVRSAITRQPAWLCRTITIGWRGLCGNNCCCCVLFVVHISLWCWYWLVTQFNYWMPIIETNYHSARRVVIDSDHNHRTSFYVGLGWWCEMRRIWDILWVENYRTSTGHLVIILRQDIEQCVIPLIIQTCNFLITRLRCWRYGPDDCGSLPATLQWDINLGHWSGLSIESTNCLIVGLFTDTLGNKRENLI